MDMKIRVCKCVTNKGTENTEFSAMTSLGRKRQERGKERNTKEIYITDNVVSHGWVLPYLEYYFDI